ESHHKLLHPSILLSSNLRRTSVTTRHYGTILLEADARCISSRSTQSRHNVDLIPPHHHLLCSPPFEAKRSRNWNSGIAAGEPLKRKSKVGRPAGQLITCL